MSRNGVKPRWVRHAEEARPGHTPARMAAAQLGLLGWAAVSLPAIEVLYICYFCVCLVISSRLGSSLVNL